jgi:hypothetical protein
VHGVFTRIRSGAIVVASYGGTLGSTLFSIAAVRTSGDSLLDLLGMAAAVLTVNFRQSIVLVIHWFRL